MNLEQTIEWQEKRIRDLEKAGAVKAQIKSDEKFLSWHKELLRYRLFLSEYINEIALSEKDIFTKIELLELLESEIDDWRLREIEK